MTQSIILQRQKQRKVKYISGTWIQAGCTYINPFTAEPTEQSHFSLSSMFTPQIAPAQVKMSTHTHTHTHQDAINVCNTVIDPSLRFFFFLVFYLPQLHYGGDGYQHNRRDGLSVFTEGVVGLAACLLRGKRGGFVCTVNIYSDTCWMKTH